MHAVDVPVQDQEVHGGTPLPRITQGLSQAEVVGGGPHGVLVLGIGVRASLDDGIGRAEHPGHFTHHLGMRILGPGDDPEAAIGILPVQTCQMGRLVAAVLAPLGDVREENHGMLLHEGLRVHRPPVEGEAAEVPELPGVPEDLLLAGEGLGEVHGLDGGVLVGIGLLFRRAEAEPEADGQSRDDGDETCSSGDGAHGVSSPCPPFSGRTSWRLDCGILLPSIRVGSKHTRGAVRRDRRRSMHSNSAIPAFASEPFG